jgi:cell division protein FtsA
MLKDVSMKQNAPIKFNRPIICGLDIGSSKVALVIGAINEDGKIEIVGVGQSANTGIRQGVVVNIEATTAAIVKAREEAELMSGYKVSQVWVGVSGMHIKSFDSRGMVAIKNQEVTSTDIQRVIEAAEAVSVPTDRRVLHVIPRDFKVDSQDGIIDPIGMSGIRLEAAVHIVTGGQTAISNNLKCIEKAGLKTSGLVLDQLAAATSVLSEDEKSLGVCVVDMGGGTCNLVYYVNGSVAQTAVVSVGGIHFTHDIAIGLRTPQMAAEDLKIKYGKAMPSLIQEDEVIDVEGVGGRKSRTVMRKDLAEVIEPRAEEILQMIKENIQASGLLHQLGSGVVLTGGASLLDGLVEMGEFAFDIPVRRGSPGSVGGLTEVVRSPVYATAVGLLLFGLSESKDLIATAQKDSNDSWDVMFDSVSNKVKKFFDQMF